MTISVEEKLPEFTFKTPSDSGPADVSVAELFGGKKVVLFGVPGAFTPTCHANHLPGYLEHYDAIKAKGVDAIAVLSVNDVHVMNAWRENTMSAGKIEFLADGNGDFAKAIGLDVDLGVATMGLRSKRFSMVVEDGVVKTLNIADNPGQIDTSGADTIMQQI